MKQNQDSWTQHQLHTSNLNKTSTDPKLNLKNNHESEMSTNFKAIFFTCLFLDLGSQVSLETLFLFFFLSDCIFCFIFKFKKKKINDSRNIIKIQTFQHINKVYNKPTSNICIFTSESCSTKVCLLESMFSDLLLQVFVYVFSGVFIFIF